MAEDQPCNPEVPLAPAPPRLRLRTWIAAIFSGCVFFQSLWLAFVCHNTVADFVLGMASTALSVVAAFAVWRVAAIDARPRWRLLAQIWRVPLDAVKETLQVVAWIFRALLGRPFDGGLRSEPFILDTDPPHAAGQRVVAITYPSLTPNSIVLGVLARSNRIVFHQLYQQPVGPLMRRLGTRA